MLICKLLVTKQTLYVYYQTYFMYYYRTNLESFNLSSYSSFRFIHVSLKDYFSMNKSRLQNHFSYRKS